MATVCHDIRHSADVPSSAGEGPGLSGAHARAGAGRRRTERAVTNQYYEFQVDGTLSARARDVFCDMDLEETRPGVVLRGTVMDDSHLHGILEQLRALGLTVVSAHPVDPLGGDRRR
jgi:hypothetical protein